MSEYVYKHELDQTLPENPDILGTVIRVSSQKAAKMTKKLTIGFSDRNNGEYEF
jgi:hypothetical protein